MTWQWHQGVDCEAFPNMPGCRPKALQICVDIGRPSRLEGSAEGKGDLEREEEEEMRRKKTTIIRLSIENARRRRS